MRRKERAQRKQIRRLMASRESFRRSRKESRETESEGSLVMNEPSLKSRHQFYKEV
jgi:hypothetical protein